MKTLKKIFLLIFISLPFLTNGCYTVLWTPDEDFPNQSSYESDDSYYVEDYQYYYDYPWWLSFAPPSNSKTDGKIYERDNGTQNIRNNGNGRNTSDSGREILTTPPPTKTIPPDKGSDNSSVNKDNTSTNTNRTETVNSNNSNNTQRQDSSSGNNGVRNNDGSRNNGRGR